MKKWAAVTSINRPSLVLAGAAVTVIALFFFVIWGIARENTQPRQRGAAIFYGDTKVSGRLAGHDLPLPTLATRCANCHESARTTQEKAPFAQALTSQYLQTPQTRRGGPPSTFNTQKLCELLRNGVDPATIIISTTMPRYNLTDSQCEDIWAFLETR